MCACMRACVCMHVCMCVCLCMYGSACVHQVQVQLSGYLISPGEPLAIGYFSDTRKDRKKYYKKSKFKVLNAHA